MTRSERLARHYIHALDLRAVYISAGAVGVKVGLTRDPEGKAKALKRGRAKILAVAWLPTSSDAAAVAGVIRFDGRAPTAAIARAALTMAAHTLDMVLTDDADVQGRVSAVVADIERRVAAMQASGHLRGLNAEYRAARAEASRRGVPIMSYGEYLARYKIRMAREIGRALR